MSGKNVWVSPNGANWDVKVEGAGKPVVTKPTQGAAIDAGRKIAEQKGSDLIIQRPNGQIRDRDSHGNESKVPDKDGHKAKK